MPAEMKPFILLAKDNKSCRLQTPYEMLLPHLQCWLPSTSLMALSDAASVLGHHDRLLATHRLSNMRRQRRGMWVPLAGVKGRGITRPCLLGFACTHMQFLFPLFDGFGRVMTLSNVNSTGHIIPLAW